MTAPVYDIAIIGGGINGAGIARDAAGRGLKVFLCDKSDLGSATSSASTKLIHGGLRYLEHYEFRLVRHALAEREVLWGIAPHIIWPLRFVLPHRKGLRPAWLLRLGLFLYDHIGGRKKLPGTKTLRLNRHEAGKPLRDVSSIGFEYSDCWVQDNRLVVLNARDAEAHGADIRTRTRCTRAVREAGTWRLSLENLNAGTVETIRAKALVNAAGPWVDRVLATAIGRNAPGSVRLVQGSHIVVPKLYDHDRCYIFQNPDGRIVFAIPYEDDFTLIGTTDVDYAGDPAAVAITQTEVDYLRAAASAYFDRTIAPGDVVWTYSGVRPLYDDGKANAQETTRDYVLTLDGDASQPPLLNIFGGKITTYRCLAEEALARLSERFPDWAHGHGWTKSKHLPGGDFPMGEADRVAAGLRRDYPFLTEKASRRLVRHYGSEARRILGAARSLSELGVAFGPELTEAECRYLIDHEYAQEAADIAFRRTKAGIRMSREELEALDRWMSAIRVPKSAPKGVVNG